MIKNKSVLKNNHKYKNFHELLVEASSDGMLSVDMEGIITFINPAGKKILNIDRDVVGKHITEAVDFEPTILHVLKTKQGYVDREFRLEGKGGSVHFLKTAIPLKDGKGEMVGVLDIFRNIDDVKLMVNRMSGAQAKYTIHNIKGNSEQIQHTMKMIKFAGTSESPILIQGESGTGKDIIAQAVHNYSSRYKGAYVVVNCLSMPSNLLENELFGYEDDYFSNAHNGRPGKIEMASGGSLFLNNVSYIPIELQNKLAKVLINKSVVRSGGFKEIPIDIRLITSSHLDISEMVNEKTFSNDLYSLIKDVTICTTPLRFRKEDIETISNETLKQFNLMNGTNKKLSLEALEILNKYDWPDNVRELEKTVEYAYFNTSSDVILPENLLSKVTKAKPKTDENVLLTLEEAEEQAVKRALEFTNNNIAQAAKILGIGRNTMYSKMKKFNIV